MFIYMRESIGIEFFVEKRKNRYQTKGVEWALNARSKIQTWTIRTWTCNPSKKSVEDTIEVFMQGLDYAEKIRSQTRLELEYTKGATKKEVIDST